MADHGDSPTASEDEDGDGKMPARPKTSDEKHRNERQKRPKRKRSASSQSGEGLDAMVALAQPSTTNALGASSTLDMTQTSASSQLPSSVSITVPNQSQPLNLQHLFGMAAPTLFHPLVAGQDSTHPSRPGDTSVLDQQQQLALLQQLWGLATYPILASSLAMHLPGNFVNHPAAAANPSFVLPSLTNKPALYPFAPTGAASTSATSPDLNALIHQARMIVEAAAQQGPREAPPDPDPSTTGRPPFVLYIACDDDSLSDYQCLVRRQIEVFEATMEDVESNAQGRNRPIVLGQVGIRCRHCAMLPPKHRARGAVYYPAKLQGIYQAAQNLAVAHLGVHCLQIPGEIRDQLNQLRERKSSAGGGKNYWADGVRVLGVTEGPDGLRFAK